MALHRSTTPPFSPLAKSLTIHRRIKNDSKINPLIDFYSICVIFNNGDTYVAKLVTMLTVNIIHDIYILLLIVYVKKKQEAFNV